MNKKSLFIKLLILVVGGVGVFLLSSCFSAAIGMASCKKNCQESCRSETVIVGNEYGIYYDLSADGSGYYVTEIGYGETEVVIPESYNGLPVIGIKRGALTHTTYTTGISCGSQYGYVYPNIASLTLPKTIEVIEYGVFEGEGNYDYYETVCKKLCYEGTLEDWFKIDFGSSLFFGNTEFYAEGQKVTNLVVPDSVTRIGKNTFARCDGLKSVTFHENVAVIEENAFYGCNGLTKLEFPCADLTVGACAFYDCAAVESITFTGEKLVLENYAFAYEGNLKEVDWNNVSVTVIPEGAFYNCGLLKTFVIPASVEVIREDAFRGCYSLEEVYNFSALQVVAGMPQYGYVAYYAGVVHTSEDDGAYILTAGDYKIVMSESGNSLFKYTGEGGALNLPVLASGETYDIKDNTFEYYTGILSVNIPECVTAIGVSAFDGCEKLKIVSGCAGITSVGRRAFFNCLSLETVALGKVEEIGDNAFGWCEKLTAVALPEDLKIIGKGAFLGCSALNTLVLPKSLTEIGQDAFKHCGAELTFAGTLEEWLQVKLSEEAVMPAKVTCADGEVWNGKI